MNSIRIGRASLSDAAVLAEIGARTFVETFGASNRPEDLKALLESSYGVAQQSAELEDPDVLTLLAYRDAELAGFAQVRRKPAPSCVLEAHSIELHRFYLVRSAQGTGIAAPLMLKVRAAARELGGRHLWLGVWEHNPRAVAFYIKSGFTRIGSHDFMVGSDRQTDWVFIAPLSGQVGNYT